MHYDIIIVGGGLVGASLALALNDTPLSICLIDAKTPSNDDPRLFALNDSSCQLLKNINVWNELKMFVSPIHQVHVSHRGYFGSVKLNSRDVHLDSLGHVIPAKNLETVFNVRLRTCENIKLFQPATLKKIIKENGKAKLVVEMAGIEKVLYASIILAADGTESHVRSQLNIPTQYHDYQQSAIVTRTKLQRSHHHIAYERFIKNGAIAMLPLLDNECATIWSGENKLIADLMTLDEEEFLQQLQTQFGYRLGRLRGIHQRFMFPLRQVKSEKVVDECVFLLGNAAHTLHPIAAQGFNLALYEVASLVEQIKSKLTKNQPLDLLEIYSNIQLHSSNSIKLSHRLATLFSSQSILLNVMLQFGMAGLEIATPIKLKFIRSLLGRNNNVPSLLLKASEL